MTLSYKIKQDQRAPTQVSRAKRPLHRAYSALSVLFALLMLAVVGVGIVGASPSTIQYGVGWFYDGAQTGSAVTPATSDSPMQPAAAPDEIGFERQLFLLINKLRVDKGLAPLVSNKALTNAARTHAKDMGKASQFSIVDANGTLPAQRVAAAGYAQAQSLHELISAGFSKPDQALAALTANSTTASILLGTDINEIGIGYNFASKDRVYQNYWTIDLGKRGGTNFTVAVNNGAESTTSPQVTLQIDGKEWAKQMLISNSPDYKGANWEPFASTKTWTLTSDTGPKKVYVKLSGAGNQTGAAIGQIALVPAVKASDSNPSHPTQTALAAPRAPTLRRIAGDVAATGTTASGSTTTLSIAATSASLAPGYYQTSEYMLGKVAVGIVLPQCNGTIDKCTEAWNSTAMTQVVNQITTAMNWWTLRMNGRVTFVFDQHLQATTGYEPINHPQSDEGLWIGDVMTNLGFNGTSYFEQVYAYDNWMRQKYATDWAFTIFVANSINNQSGTFSDGYFAYSYIPGPFTVSTYDNDGYGVINMSAVVAHETGHIFGALDEYPGAGSPCTDTSGYLIAQNQNSQLGSCTINQDSIMRGGTAPYINNQVDPYAMAMLGNRASSGNLPDPINTKPVVMLNSVTSPTNTNTPTITGIAQDQPYTPPSGGAFTINQITGVQYRVDGGAWQNALPLDGTASFNQVAEGFTFTPSLANGTHTIQVQAINRVNNVSDLATVSLIVQGTTIQPTPIPPTPVLPTPILPTPIPPTPTTVPVVPTVKPVVPTPTNVPPTATLVPTVAPTPTKVPPTATAVPPTATTVPPTPTRVPPTATAVPTTSASSGTLIIKINAGSNAIALPYSFYKASTLIAAINAQGGSVTEADQWDGKAWKPFKPGSGVDFNIDGDAGYIVKASAPSTWVVPVKQGNAVTKIQAQKGWDAIGVPICKDGSLSCYTASTLAAAINAHGGGVAEIDRMVNGSWSAYLVGYTFNDFAIVAGQGYFVRSTKAVDWTP